MNVLRIVRNGEVISENPLADKEGLIRLPPCTGEEKFEVELEDFSVPAGTPGFFLIPNVRSSSSCGGLIFFKERSDAVEEFNESWAIPVFGVNTGEAGVLAVVTGARYDYTLKVEVRGGAYKLTTVFGKSAVTPEIRLLRLKGKETSYAGMARCYRNFQIARGVCRPLKERCAENPVLAQSVRSIMVRMRMAWKPAPSTVLEQTEENEPPVHAAITFKRAKEILRRFKAAGIDNAEFCLVGWNKGGHDGAFPDLFPVEKTLGSEDDLRDLLRYAKECGYLMSGHTNLVDSYSFSKRCTPHDRLVDEDGSFHLGGKWGGGQSYYLCPKEAFERFAKEDFEAMKELGFRGTHYLDVASIAQPNTCFHPDHPLSKEGNAFWRSKTLALAREVFGASSSEGSIDFCIGDLDYVLYANFGLKLTNPPALIDRFIPFWSLVYHGIVTSNCAFTTVNEMVKDDPELHLYNLEWGGRPTAYFHAKFRPSQDKPEPDLRCSTDEELDSGIAALAERAAEFDKMSDLQLEFIEEHDEVAPGVIEERYSDGSVMRINRSDRPFGELPPRSWRLERAGGRQLK